MSVLNAILPKVIAQPEQHAKWLNTLSFLENVGARKISAAESSSGVSLSMLKHAAEEARHAFFLKRQIQKEVPNGFATYQSHELFSARATRHYLQRLDVRVCRLLKERLGLAGASLKHAAYLLVTYAIEVRALEFYPIYQTTLQQQESRISVKSIIAEEKGHLQQMEDDIHKCFDDPSFWKKEICQLENAIYHRWLTSVQQEVC